jgi:hypothetical protein
MIDVSVVVVYLMMTLGDMITNTVPLIINNKSTDTLYDMILMM